MRLLIITCIYLFSTAAQAVEIDNFKSGLMCNTNKDNLGWVCFEQTEIYISGQSSCASGNEVFPCTWYGYSFDYKNAKANQLINCNYFNSEPTTLVNIDGLVAEVSGQHSFSFNLPAQEGYFVNPQYSELRVATDANNSRLLKVKCFADDALLFEYQFTTIYPID